MFKLLNALIALALLGFTLSILFLDIGSFTAWRWEYPEIKVANQGTIREANPQIHAQKIIKIIQDYRVNYLVLEREEIDYSPNRPVGSCGEKDFKNYLQTLCLVLEYCHSHQIKGCAILPRTQQETRKWREQKNYCWRYNWSSNEHYCHLHQRVEITKVKTLDEIDARCIQEIFSYRIKRNPELLLERERIFNSPMKIKKVPDYQKTKTEKLNNYRVKQINYYGKN